MSMFRTTSNKAYAKAGCSLKIVPELKTLRTVLRDISPRDADFIVSLRSDENICQYFLSPRKISLREHLDWYYNCYIHDDDRMDWIARIGANEPIGVFGIKVNRDKRLEISYLLSPMYYGKGYATECINRLICFCRGSFESHSLIATIHKDNARSVKFIERMGFEIDSRMGDFIVYSKTI